jgi:hypothetical protein
MMSTKQEEQRITQQKKQEEQRITQQKKQEVGLLEAVVRDNVLSKLGQPDDLHRVQVKCVWGNNYRVNVFIGPDAVSSKVAHSYFLKADEDGKILSYDPAITRVY